MPRIAMAGLVGLALVLTACPAATDRATTAAAARGTQALPNQSTESIDEPAGGPTQGTVGGGGCPADLVESNPADGAEHVAEGETVEYDTNPPMAGPHAAGHAETGVIYGAEQAPPVHQLVHNMEHGAVVFWTNNLSEDEQSLAETTVGEIYEKGYTSLIMVEYNDMEFPFAMTAWGVLQGCEAMDETTAELMHEFTDTFYGSGIEGFLACTEAAAELPACKE